MRQCAVCNKLVVGRLDKKFCSKDCSNQFHSVNRKKMYSGEVGTVNKILLKNRTILNQLFESNTKKKLKLPRLVLAQLGFDFNYLTGIYKNRQGKTYHYIYDFAWMEFSTQEVLIINK